MKTFLYSLLLAFGLFVSAPDLAFSRDNERFEQQQAFLSLNELQGFSVVESAPPVGTFITAVHDATNLTTYTFTGASIGTAADDRFVLVAITGRGNAGATRTVSSATIGGNAATLLTNDSAVGGTRWIGLTVTTGTTATIAVTMSGQMTALSLQIFTVTGLSSTTLVDADFLAGTADPSISTINASAGGIVFGAYYNDDNTGTAAWTGITEVHDTNQSTGGEGARTSAMLQFAAAQVNMTVSVNSSASNTECSLSVITLR